MANSIEIVDKLQQTSTFRAWAALYCEDVRARPEHYKRHIVANPLAAASRIADGLSDGEIRRLTRELKAEINEIEMLT